MFNVAINGYGRIGRNVLRALYERPELNGKIQVVAINDLGAAEMNAHLTQFDTTHGRFNQPVSVDEDHLIIGSDRIRMLSERDPKQLPWEQSGTTPYCRWCKTCSGIRPRATYGCNRRLRYQPRDADRG